MNIIDDIAGIRDPYSVWNVVKKIQPPRFSPYLSFTILKEGKMKTLPTHSTLTAGPQLKNMMIDFSVNSCSMRCPEERWLLLLCCVF